MDGIAAVVFIVLFLLGLGFIAHELEEIIVQHKWMMRNAATLKLRFPKLKRLFEHLLTLDSKAFFFAVIEETIVLALVIFFSLSKGWSLLFFGIFFAYALHLLVHIIQGILFRGYVPGLVTACIFFPIFSCFSLSIFAFYKSSDAIALVAAGLAGICFLLVNLLFSHWLGKKISSLFDWAS